MRIIRMEATFGKLEKAELSLKPGLNILQGENEWGKSTWCAFILAMFYGLDTRAKTTKTALADKERYAPWAGSPMAGRMDLCWKGRNITIERSTKGRIPLGVFRAYETESGLAVPELTAANCGQLLLGVEQSVLRRAGFIRFTDLPVNEDEALRRRLNALVTTGDESGEGETLEKGLRELKNRCRYHRTGLLPQAEAERSALEEKKNEITALRGHIASLEQRLEEETKWQAQLENHRAALEFSSRQADAWRVEKAKQEAEAAEAEFARWEAACAALPSREVAREKLRQLAEYRQQWEAARQEQESLPREPEPDWKDSPFAGMTPEQAEQKVWGDTRQYNRLRRGKGWVTGLAVALLLILTGVLAWLGKWIPMGAALTAGAVSAISGFVSRGKRRKIIRDLQEFYGTPTPQDWQLQLDRFRQQTRDHACALLQCRTARSSLDARLQRLKILGQSLCGGQTPETVAAVWQQTLDQWQCYDNARQRREQTGKLYDALRTMAKPAVAPSAEDALTLSEQETASMLTETAREQNRLQQRLGQYRGRMEALGEPDRLEVALQRVNRKIRELEDIYAAADLALETLEQTRQTLQRRFAPRITRRAQELLTKLTRGRYTQLQLSRDLSLHARTGEEPVLREAMWRSDGTMDQLYLALRLAVAEELTPHAPLVLDDALVRFDDQRLAAALEVLGEISQTRQILLFTCQSRENTMLSDKL